MLASRALRIVTTQTGVPDYEPAADHLGLNDPKWKEWIKLVTKAGVKPSWSALGSAHQMGSNAMGTKPTNSAVDPRGRVWGTESLYVADAVSCNLYSLSLSILFLFHPSFEFFFGPAEFFFSNSPSVRSMTDSRTIECVIVGFPYCFRCQSDDYNNGHGPFDCAVHRSRSSCRSQEGWS